MNAAYSTNSTNELQLSRWAYYPILAYMALGFFCFYEYSLRLSPNLLAGGLLLNQTQDALRLTHFPAFYEYLYLPLQLVAGIVLDTYSFRRWMILACLGCVFGICLFTIADTVWEAELGRMLQILGSSFAFIGVLKFSSLYFPRKHFTTLVGMALSFAISGGIIGHFYLKPSLIHTTWWVTNLYIASFGLLIAILLCGALYNRKAQYQKFIAAKSSLSDNLHYIANISAHSQILLLSGIGGLIYLPIISFAQTWGLQYWEQVMHFTLTDAYRAGLMGCMGLAVGAPLLGWLSDKINLRILPLTAGTMLSAIMVSAIIYLPGVSDSAIFALMFTLGFCGGSLINLFSIASKQSNYKYTGITLAALYFFSMTVALVCLAMINGLFKIYQLAQASHIFVYLDNSYQLGFLFLPLGLIIAGILTFFIDDNYTQLSSKID